MEQDQHRRCLRRLLLTGTVTRICGVVAKRANVTASRTQCKLPFDSEAHLAGVQQLLSFPLQPLDSLALGFKASKPAKERDNLGAVAVLFGTLEDFLLLR
jgi:hypothetical protein